MAKKSDHQAQERVSATEASRSFSRLLDEIEAGRRFLVHRRGQDICLMTPPVGAGRKASECLALLRSRTPVLLDGRFGEDLLDILGTEPVDEALPWDS